MTKETQADFGLTAGPPALMEIVSVRGEDRLIGEFTMPRPLYLPLVANLPLANGVPKDYDVKASNPKEAVGSDKAPIHLFPTTAIVAGSLAMTEGLCKYGRSNFRAVGVKASTYYSAFQRHVMDWFEGTDIDPESGLHHLWKAEACIAILIDAIHAGKLNDDRMIKGGDFPALLKDAGDHVKRLKAEHAHRSPRHYTIADTPLQRGPTDDELDGCKGSECLTKGESRG